MVRDVMVGWPQLCCMTKWWYTIKLKWTLTYSSPAATAELERVLQTEKNWNAAEQYEYQVNHKATS